MTQVSTAAELMTALQQDGANIELIEDITATEDATASTGFRVPSGQTVTLFTNSGKSLKGTPDSGGCHVTQEDSCHRILYVAGTITIK